MKLELSPQKKKALEDAAKAEGKDPRDLLSEIVDRYLKERKRSPTSRKGWLRKVEGSFAGDPAFDEVVRLGEEFRKSVE